jgi:hypothetical protein
MPLFSSVTKSFAAYKGFVKEQAFLSTVGVLLIPRAGKRVSIFAVLSRIPTNTL